jgi:integrase
MATLTRDRNKLALDFFWKGVRCREYLGLDAGNKDHEREARKLQRIVEGEVASGSLDFAARFPRSKRVRVGGPFAPPPAPAAPEAPPTFQVFAEAWLGRQRGCVAYLQDLDSMLRTHLLPRYGSRLVGAISVEDVETLLVDLRHQGLGPVRANKIRALLSRLLERAMRNKLRADNPVLDVRAERGKKAEVDPLSFAEVRRLFEVGLAGDEESRRLYTVKIFTGLRTSELLGLQWDDVDLKAAAPVASIRRSVTKADGVHGVKTEGSERTIDLRPQVVAAQRPSGRPASYGPTTCFPRRSAVRETETTWRPACGARPSSGRASGCGRSTRRGTRSRRWPSARARASRG